MPRLWPEVSQDPHPWRRCYELKGRGIPVTSGKDPAPCAQPTQCLAPGLVHIFPVRLKLPVSAGSCPKSWAWCVAASSLPAHGTDVMAPCPISLPHAPDPGRGCWCCPPALPPQLLGMGQSKIATSVLTPCSQGTAAVHTATAVPGAFLAERGTWEKCVCSRLACALFV